LYIRTKKGIAMKLVNNIKQIPIKYFNKETIRKHAGKIIWAIVRSIILIGLSYVILYPFLVKVVSAFMGSQDLLDPTVKYFPRNPSFEYIFRAIEGMNYYKALTNTAILSLLVAFGQLLVSSLSGYGFAKFNFRFKSLIFTLLMLTLIVPPQVLFIPLFLSFKDFGFGSFSVNVLNTFIPFSVLSLTGIGLRSGLYIFLMRQFFRGMPKELEEAASIDGAGVLKTFLVVIIPNSFNMILTVFLFSFTWQWTETFHTSLFLSDLRVISNSIGMVAMISRDDPIIIATLFNIATLLAVIPLLIIYLFAQRFFVQSIERSGIVG